MNKVKKRDNDNYTKLVGELMDFLLANGKVLKELPSDATYVAFSAHDHKLNKQIEKLVETVKKEGKPVIQAFEPLSKKDSWKFSVVSA